MTIVGDDQVALGVHRGLGVVADDAAAHGAGRLRGHRDRQGYLSVRRILKGPVHGLQALDLLPDTAVPPAAVLDPLRPRPAVFLAVDATMSSM